jgi:hypothetical protein
MNNLIDDMEENSPGILPRGKRSGPWFTYNDMSDGGVQTPTAGGTCLPSVIPDGGRCGSSLHAMHTFGAGFTNYGMGIGFNLNEPASMKMPYDVSGFTGVAFWALGPQDLEVQVPIQATVPKSDPSGGGTCTAVCNDHFYAQVSIGPGWQQYTVPFCTLSQKHFGTPATWDAMTVLGVQFAVNPAPKFDYWIDDIGFY